MTHKRKCVGVDDDERLTLRERQSKLRSAFLNSFRCKGFK